MLCVYTALYIELSFKTMIRKVRLDDAPAIANIYNPFITQTTVSFETEEVSTEQMAQRIADISAHYPYYVYEEDGKLLGYCYLHAWKERAAYAPTLELTIYLAPEAQSRGIGRPMVEQLIADARQMQVHALIACITQENEHSVRFHQSLGFKQVSHFKNVGYKLGRMLDVVDLELEL